MSGFPPASCPSRYLVAVQHGDVTAHGAHRRAGREADGRIAPEMLAADHRFEQVGIRPVGKLEIDRQRRVEVGAGFENDGNAVVALRGEPREFCFSHLLLHEKLSESGIGRARPGGMGAIAQRSAAPPAPATPLHPNLSSFVEHEFSVLRRETMRYCKTVRARM